MPQTDASATLPRMLPRLATLSVLILLCGSVAGAENRYDVLYRAAVDPNAGLIHLEIHLSGERLPSQVALNIDPQRHLRFRSTDAIEVTPERVVWKPKGKLSRLSYDFVVNHRRGSGGYDSYLTKEWALFRGDKLVPRAAVTARRGLHSRAQIEFVLPTGWSSVTPYPPAKGAVYSFDDPERRFDRPSGWMLTGRYGSRNENIAGTQATVAAPSGDNARRQDVLAFLNWNLPRLKEVFPDFPKRLLIVSAGDPMWRGGLSGPASLFLHADRPLISENRTSTLLHELVHVAMGIRGDPESDWIVEGFAEYYSIEILHRSGGIGENRYRDAMANMARWAKGSPNLFAGRSSSARTARAVLVLKAVDDEVRDATAGRSNLDEVARELARQGGEVSLENLQTVAAKFAGRPLQSLQRSTLLSLK